MLKILAEESVKKAKYDILEGDKKSSSLGKQIQRDLDFYMNVNEQEGADEPIEDEPMVGGTPDEEIEAADEDEIEEPEAQQDVPEEMPTAELEPERGPGAGSSFSGVQDQINQIRAGRSVRDSAVNPILRSYYDTLDDNERVVLSTFLKALASGLSGGIESSDELQDPSMPPVSIVMSKAGEKEEEEGADEPAEPAEYEEKAMEMMGAEPDIGEEEFEEEEAAAEPPIKIGESQDLSLIRKKAKISHGIKI